MQKGSYRLTSNSSNAPPVDLLIPLVEAVNNSVYILYSKDDSELLFKWHNSVLPRISFLEINSIHIIRQGSTKERSIPFRRSMSFKLCALFQRTEICRHELEISQLVGKYGMARDRMDSGLIGWIRHDMI